MDDNRRNADQALEQLKLPPHSIEAEQSVLGSMLIAPDSWDKVVEIVGEEDFYNRAHRVIFAAMLKLLSANQVVDTTTVKNNLEQFNQLDEAGGFAYLIELSQNTPSAANVTAYAEIIKERAIVRELIGVAHDIAEIGYHPEGRNSTDILDIAESKVFEIAQKRQGENEGPKDVTDVLTKTVTRLDELVKQGSEITGVSTGFHDLDKKTSGLQPSDLIIVAARPSMGKCIVSGSTVLDPSSGQLHKIDDLVARKCAHLVSIDNDFKTTSANATQFVDDGLKPVFRVTTALGKTIETTLTHPFLSGSGWRPLSELKVGDRVAIPRSLPYFGDVYPPSHEVKALGYMISDGSTTNNSPTFTNVNEQIAGDFIDAMQSFNGVSIKKIQASNRAQSYRIVAKQKQPTLFRKRFALALRNSLSALQMTAKSFALTLGIRPSTVSEWQNANSLPSPAIYMNICQILGPQFKETTFTDWQSASTKYNAVTAFLDKCGLNNKLAHQKVLPSFVYTWNAKSISLLLNRMFACDGSAFTQKNGQSRVSYATSSAELGKQIQHLLLRFGVIAKLRQKKCKYINAQPQFEVEIMQQESLIAFVDQIGIFGKQAACDLIFSNIFKKNARSNAEKLPTSVNQYILQLKGERSWSQIFNDAGQACPDGFNPHLVGHSKRNMTRERIRFFAELFNDHYLHNLSNSDVYWDKIVKIEYQGYKQVYDLTVPKFHNFVAQDFFVHNTTFAMNLVENAMMMQDKPVLVFSLEMPAEQIMMRMLASLSRVNQTNIRTAQLDDTEWSRISATIKHLKEKDSLFIDDSSGLTPMELRTRARKIVKERGGLSMIMVDYLQLMRVPSLSENRTLEIAEISRSLKALAKELSVPVVALSQLNRGLEQRADKRPINSDLRESGSIEQDADLIMFIYRDEVYHENSELKGIAEIIIGKQRNGPIGTCRLTFQGQFSRFDNYAGPEYDDE